MIPIGWNKLTRKNAPIGTLMVGAMQIEAIRLIAELAQLCTGHVPQVLRVINGVQQGILIF